MFSHKVLALLLILGSVHVAIGVSDRKLSYILQSYIGFVRKSRFIQL